MDLLDYAEGCRRRDDGIKRAVTNAENNTPGWKDFALRYIIDLPPGSEFLAEDVRAIAHADGLPEPPDGRAWGGVIRKARGMGLIEHRGFKPCKNPKSHACPSNEWKRTEKGVADV